MILVFVGCQSTPEQSAGPEAAPKEAALSPQNKDDSEHGHAKHWSYHGETGPENWGSLNKAWAMCDHGKNQSPVDLKFRKPRTDKKVVFNYQESDWSVVDNGHTIQINFTPGNFVMIDNVKYDLVQAHFHSPSEHTIAGRSYHMEAHFVHKNSAGELAVLGVMFNEGKNSHPALTEVWSQIPKEKNTPVAGSKKVNPKVFFPNRPTFYSYNGSLTTPPCTEGVQWVVFNTPMALSAGQLKTFNTYYLGTNRPIQSMHDRQPANYQ